MRKSSILVVQIPASFAAVAVVATLAVCNPVAWGQNQSGSSATPGQSQPGSGMSPGQSQAGTGAGAAASPSQISGIVDVSKLDQAQVTNKQGEQLGSIKQILVDPQSGMIRFAVIHVDAQNDVAVPWMALNVSQSSGSPKITLDATKDKLDKAPKVNVGEAERLFSRETAQPIYEYWSVIWVEAPNPVGEGSPGQGNEQSTPQTSPQGNSSPSSESPQ